MQIRELTLKTDRLRELYEFYVDLLGLLPLDRSQGHFTLDAGASRLTFQAAEAAISAYHFAFNIPHNQLADAQLWLFQRVPLLTTAAGSMIITHAENWDAKALYFLDPAGNLVEFVARYRVPDNSDLPFSAQSILNISEVGLAVEDVPATAGYLRAEFSLPAFGTGGVDFQALGDDEGLLILAEVGRVWFPTQDVTAQVQPTTISLRGSNLVAWDSASYPYQVVMVAEEESV